MLRKVGQRYIPCHRLLEDCAVLESSRRLPDPVSQDLNLPHTPPEICAGSAKVTYQMFSLGFLLGLGRQTCKAKLVCEGMASLGSEMIWGSE